MSSTYEATGYIVHIGQTTQISDTFKKRDLVIELPDGQYPQQIKFQVTGDRTASLERFSEGEQVKVCFNLKGRGYERKSDGGRDWYLNLDVWKIDSVEYDQTPQDKTGMFPDEEPSQEEIPF
jgi:single-strand DNA-binding protein